MRASRTVGLVAALSLLASGPFASGAEPEPPLLVFYAAPELGRNAQPVRAALDAVAQRAGTALVDLSPAIPPPEAPLHLRRAIEAYHDFRYAEALTSADAGLIEAANTGGLGLSATDLSDLLIYRALALTERGDSAGAWQDFVRAVTLDPSRTLDPVRYPPRVMETFGRAVKAVAASPPATLTVDLPAGCELWLDGRAANRQRSLTTTRGEHYLRARCPGRVPYAARVLVAEDTQRVTPELPALAPPTAPQVGAMATERGFRAAVAAILTGGGTSGAPVLLTLRWVAPPGDPPRGLVVLKLPRADRPDGVAEAVNRLMAPPGAIAAGPARPAAGSGKTPWYRNPWLWGVAGAAIAAAVLVPFAVDTQPPPTNYHVELPPTP